MAFHLVQLPERYEEIATKNITPVLGAIIVGKLKPDIRGLGIGKSDAKTLAGTIPGRSRH